MGRAPCCDEKMGLKKGPWTPQEDQKLVAYIQEHGHESWRALPEKAGLSRCGKSCRLRWTNYLRPDIKRGRFSLEEDEMIIQLHAMLGNRWSAIASHLPRRTDNEIKNYWNTHLKKRLAQVGIDSVTHKTSSRGPALLDMTPTLKPLLFSEHTHMTQWDCARAEAEARLSKSSPVDLVTKRNVVGSAHSSVAFMNSWKSQVQETLGSFFGTVRLEPTSKIDTSPVIKSVNVLKCLDKWNVSLQSVQSLNYIPLSESLDAMAGTSAADLASKFDSLNETPVARANSFRASSSWRSTSNDSTITESDMFSPSDCTNSGDYKLSSTQSNIYSSLTGCGRLENQWSPTSILHGPDSDFKCADSNSPCASSTGSDYFEILHQSSYQCFPLVPQDADQLSTTGFSDMFWERQEAEMLDAMQPDCLLESADATDNGIPFASPDINNVQLPHLDSLCQDGEFQTVCDF